MREAIHVLEVHLAGLNDERRRRERQLLKAGEVSDTARALRQDIDNLQMMILQTSEGLGVLRQTSGATPDE